MGIAPLRPCSGAQRAPRGAGNLVPTPGRSKAAPAPGSRAEPLSRGRLAVRAMALTFLRNGS